jgi:hypothetical protein
MCGPGTLATKHCGDCKKVFLFCDACHAFVHRKGGSATSHTSIPVETRLAAEALEAGLTFAHRCVTHCKPIDLHCTQCHMAICADCGNFEHNGHTKATIVKSSAGHRAVLEALATASASGAAAKATAAAARTKWEGRQNKVKRTAEVARSKVKRVVDTLRAAVDRFENAANIRIIAAEDTNRQALDVHAAEAGGVVELAACAVALANDTVNRCTAVEQLLLRPVLVEGLAAIAQHTLPPAALRTASVVTVDTVHFEQLSASFAAAKVALGPPRGGGGASAMATNDANDTITIDDMVFHQKGSGAARSPDLRRRAGGRP